MPVRIFDEREIELLREVMASGRLSSLGGGTVTPRFEAAFAEALGAQHAVAMNSAMSVLHASVAASGAGAGDEVICDPVCVFGAVATMYNNQELRSWLQSHLLLAAQRLRFRVPLTHNL